ncbi:MAG: hypothetical protein LBH16_07970 [Treponema sp.]|jgi:hypothetical protein|nr:hypothetical protein [Treponema sp.]
MKLLEWNTQKIIVMLRKLAVLLQKKTGEKYTVISIPDAYKNVWGRFIGYWIISNRKKVFRINFIAERINQANVVSIDRFPDDSTGEGKPITTLSLEGFGIGKVFFSLVDFMKINNAQATLQLIETVENIHEEKWSPQPLDINGKTNRRGYAANFLGENPAWISKIENDNFDPAKLASEFKTYLIKNGFNVSGYGAPKFFDMLKNAIISFDDLGGEKAANNIPTAKVVRGVPNQTINVPPPSTVNRQLTALQQEIENYKPKGEAIADLKECVKKMLNVPKYSTVGACAWGRGGTGKSETIKQVVKEEGLVNGLGYVWITGKFEGSDGLRNCLYNNRYIPLVVIDDCDNMFKEEMQNIMKGVLQDQKIYITSKNSKIVDNDTGEAVEPLKTGYDLDSHFIFLTNKDPSLISSDGAIKSRLEIFDFNFSNEQILDNMRYCIDTAFPDLDEISSAERSKLLEYISEALDGGFIKELDWRLLGRVMKEFAFAKAMKKDTHEAVIKVLARAYRS